MGHKINHNFSKWNCLFYTLDHPRFGLIPAARSTDNIKEGEEIVCMYEWSYEEAAPWYQELWRKEIDFDHIYGPFGHRGEKHKEGEEPISAWLSNGTLYNEFYKHATEVLHLKPVS